MSRTNQCLEKYSVLESGKAILSGHIFNKIFHDIPVRTVCELENTKNNFPPVDFNDGIRLKKRNKAMFSKFEQICEVVVNFKTSTFTAPATSQETLHSYVGLIWELRKKVAKQSQTIAEKKKNGLNFAKTEEVQETKKFQEG